MWTQNESSEVSYFNASVVLYTLGGKWCPVYREVSPVQECPHRGVSLEL